MVSRNSVVFNAMLPIIYLGGAAAVQLLGAECYLKSKPDWIIVSLFFIVTAGIYLLNRIVDKEDKFNNLPRWLFFNGTTGRTYFWIALAGITLFGPVVVLVILQSFDSALLFATVAFIGVAYSVKILPFLTGKKIIWISLKDIPLLKTIVVSAIWAGASLLLAAITTNNNFFRYDILVVFATFFVSTFCSTVTSDVKDIEGDRIRKVYTLPVLFGPDVTFRLLSIVSMSSIIIISLLGFQKVISFQLTLFSCFCMGWAGLTMIPQYFKVLPISKTSIELLVDSHLMLSPIGLALFYFV